MCYSGLRCESQGPVWGYGTAVEHSSLYQYSFVGARNIFLAAIQTETAYYQVTISLWV
jgi:glucan 1,3-beta-glucosidase